MQPEVYLNYWEMHFTLRKTDLKKHKGSKIWYKMEPSLKSFILKNVGNSPCLHTRQYTFLKSYSSY